jgi:hypothetical protein
MRCPKTRAATVDLTQIIDFAFEDVRAIAKRHHILSPSTGKNKR